MPNTKSNKNAKSRSRAKPRNNNLAVSLMRNTAGSMAVATNPAKERKTIRTRQFIAPIWTVRQSSTVLSQSQSPSQVGSQYASGHITIFPNNLSSNAVEFIQNSDRFRITKAELFVLSEVNTRANTTRGTAPIVHYAYCDSDTSFSQTGGVTPWNDVVTRENVSKTTLRSNQPTMRIAHWNPRPLFDPTGGNTPANIIPSPNQWMDSLILNQEFSGVRTFSCSPADTDQSDQYNYELNYELRLTIQTQAAL